MGSPEVTPLTSPRWRSINEQIPVSVGLSPGASSSLDPALPNSKEMQAAAFWSNPVASGSCHAVTAGVLIAGNVRRARGVLVTW